MIRADVFLEPAREHGFALFTGVPCSYLKPFINYVIDDPALRYVAAANEGDAVAIAAGAQLGGLLPVVMFQNSGLGNAVNPLTSLAHTFQIPMLLIVTLRGDPSGPADEPQHALMGRITGAMLELMEVPWEYFPSEPSDIEPVLRRATSWMREKSRPYALVMRKGTVEHWPLQSGSSPRPPTAVPDMAAAPVLGRRARVLRVIQSATAADTILVATTGYTGRELYALEDRVNQFYMVGSMGCASSIGLGLALAQPERRIIVLDGDGALIMRMGAMATLGYERPANLLHILLDNLCHESTGGQETVSHSVHWPAIAAACGYRNVVAPRSLDQLEQTVSTFSSLTFCHVRTEPGVLDALPRPSVQPAEVAQRVRRLTGSGS